MFIKVYICYLLYNDPKCYLIECKTWDHLQKVSNLCSNLEASGESDHPEAFARYNRVAVLPWAVWRNYRMCRWKGIYCAATLPYPLNPFTRRNYRALSSAPPLPLSVSLSSKTQLQTSLSNLQVFRDFFKPCWFLASLGFHSLNPQGKTPLSPCFTQIVEP